jgi:hypothetical protein
VQRLVVTGLAVLGSLAVSSAAVAAGSPAEIKTSPAKFTLTSSSCPLLPKGTTLKGSGTMRSTTWTTTDAQGVTRVRNATVARGGATDRANHSYVFNYANTFRVSKAPNGPALYTGLMYDLFSLSGNGPAVLANGFVAVFTTDLGQFATFEPVHTFGDPINFKTGKAHCDPL